MRPPLLLSGPPAVGKSTTAMALARSACVAAMIDVDDVRHFVVAGHAAPWEGADGLKQQQLGVENACALGQVPEADRPAGPRASLKRAQLTADSGVR